MAFFKFIPLALLLFIGFASTQQVSDDGDDDKPYLRIVAPQYICDSKDKSNKTDSNKLTIGLQTREGQRLKYAIAIDFTILEGFKNQRHTLSIWRNVRELQKKFQAKEVADEISMRNQIEIDALEVSYRSERVYAQFKCMLRLSVDATSRLHIQDYRIRREEASE
jgi:hypothetical protein